MNWEVKKLTIMPAYDFNNFKNICLKPGRIRFLVYSGQATELTLRQLHQGMVPLVQVLS